MGGCTQRVQTTWPCLGSCGRKVLTGTGKANSGLLSCLVGPPFPVFMARFSAMAGWQFPGDLIASSLIVGCG